MSKQLLLVFGLLGLLASNASEARFVSVDPVQANANNGKSFNRYSYANNNPYKFIDPDGRQSRELNFETQRTGYVPPPRNPSDRLGPALGFALVGVLAAPAAGFAGPGVLTTAGEFAMGDALGGASLTAGGAMLFRVVDNVESASIEKFGEFLPAPNGDEVKRFVGNLPDAKALAQKFTDFFGGEQHVAQGHAPQSVLNAATTTPISDVPGRSIESIAIPNEELSKIQCVGMADGC